MDEVVMQDAETEDGAAVAYGAVPGAKSTAPPAKSMPSSPPAKFVQVVPPDVAASKGTSTGAPPKMPPKMTTNPNNIDPETVPESWTPTKATLPRPKGPPGPGLPETFLRAPPAKARTQLPQPPAGHVGGQRPGDGAEPGAPGASL